jgi:hypothetical protein
VFISARALFCPIFTSVSIVVLENSFSVCWLRSILGDLYGSHTLAHERFVRVFSDVDSLSWS